MPTVQSALGAVGESCDFYYFYGHYGHIFLGRLLAVRGSQWDGVPGRAWREVRFKLIATGWRELLGEYVEVHDFIVSLLGEFVVVRECIAGQVGESLYFYYLIVLYYFIDLCYAPTGEYVVVYVGMDLRSEPMQAADIEGFRVAAPGTGHKL